MDKRTLYNVLMSHADALNAGVDLTDDLIARFAGDAATLRPLLQLARQVKGVLVPVAAPTAFSAQLRLSLLQEARPALARSRSLSRRWRPAWVGAAAVGSLLSLAGLVVWLVRHSRALQRPRPLPA